MGGRGGWREREAAGEPGGGATRAWEAAGIAEVGGGKVAEMTPCDSREESSADISTAEAAAGGAGSKSPCCIGRAVATACG